MATKNGWKHHAPSAAQKTQIEQARLKYRELNSFLEAEVPAGRERALAVTELEYPFCRAERAIVLHEPDEQAGRCG